MGVAQAISLTVRPLQSVDLCFEVEGVLDNLVDVHLLGTQVTPFDVKGLYKRLSETASGKPEQLLFDSKEIRDLIAPSLLGELRSEFARAALDRAVAIRASEYQKNFANIPALATKSHDFFVAQHARLDQLLKVRQRHFDGLNTAYLARTDHTLVPNPAPPDAPVDIRDRPVLGTFSSVPAAGGVKTITNFTTFEYRHPILENEIDHLSATVKDAEQLLAAEQVAITLPTAKLIENVYERDLLSLTLSVRDAQIAYINSMLWSPINGTVTAVFRHPGDCVQRGQPVIRVENDEEVYLVGTIRHRGVIRLDRNVTVSTKVFDSQIPLTMSGKIRSIRGHDSQDERWDVMILCPNRSGGDPVLPINYSFDYDNTVITIS